MTGPADGAVPVRRVLPHRYPMLLVDRVVELVPERSVTALKAVTGNEPWYGELPDCPEGPDGPVDDYPAVLLLESWCQSAAVLGTIGEPEPHVLRGRVPLLGGVSAVSFAGRVHPGDVLVHRVDLVRRLADTMIFAGTSAVGAVTVMTVGSVVLALRPAAGLPAAAAPADATGAADGGRSGRPERTVRR